MKNIIIIAFFCLACNQQDKSALNSKIDLNSQVKLLVLGTIQDAGSPHIACIKDCCKSLFLDHDPTRKVVCLGIIDDLNQKTYLFEATPDMPTQLKLLKGEAGFEAGEVPNGIFLTHAHIGHYSGLMYLGKEAMNASMANVYAMPRMNNFLRNNGPWSQLVKDSNIQLNPLRSDSAIKLGNQLKVIPFIVPHRDEFSETVGYKIIGPNKTALFIPDINKWSVWNRSIAEQIKMVDYAFIDATFYDGKELNNRDISEIPHPFVIETMELLYHLEEQEKNKVYFIHFNHTNPLLDSTSSALKSVYQRGFNVARFGMNVTL